MRAGRTPAKLPATRLRPEKLGTEGARAAMFALDEAEADAVEMRGFALMPLPEQRARIDELTGAGELTPRQQRRLQKAHGRLVKGLEAAPFQTAAERGLIDAIAPLDFDDPASLAVRTTQAETIAAAYGTAVSPLRPAEARALVARLDGTPPEALPDALADLRAGLGDAAMAEIARRFATDRPHLAVALSLAEDRPDLAADILEGGRILKQALADGKADTLRPTEAELRAASASVYGSPTAHQARGPEVEAAIALYAQRTAGTTKPGFQPAVFEQAVRDVAPEGTVVDDFGMLGVAAAEAAAEEPGADVLLTSPQAAATVDTGLVESRGRPLMRPSQDVPGVSSRQHNPVEPTTEQLATPDAKNAPEAADPGNKIIMSEQEKQELRGSLSKELAEILSTKDGRKIVESSKCPSGDFSSRMNRLAEMRS